MSKRRGQQSFGELAGRLLTRIDPEGRRHRAKVVNLWDEVCGPEVAAHARGFSLENGELLVYVDSPGWAQELALLSERFRVRMNEELGEEAVLSIRFFVSRRATEPRPGEEPADEQGEAEEGPPEPISPTARTRIEEAAQEIEDEGLREAALRAARRDADRRV